MNLIRTTLLAAAIAAAPVGELPRLSATAAAIRPALGSAAFDGRCVPWTREEAHKRTYVFKVLVAGNQLLNAVTGGAPDETLSSRFGRARRRGSKTGRATCAVLDWIDPCHCETSIEFDELGRPQPHQMDVRP